jgi:hypothetical protein
MVKQLHGGAGHLSLGVEWGCPRPVERADSGRERRENLAFPTAKLGEIVRKVNTTFKRVAILDGIF